MKEPSSSPGRTRARKDARGIAPDVRKRRERRALLGLMAATAVLLCAAAGFRALMLGRPAEEIGGPYTLTDDTYHVVMEQSFHGHYTLLYFGYTHCLDVCPLTLATVTAALDRLGARGAQVVPVFISIDPARDTPARVHEYVTSFSPRIVGLTGDAQAIRNVAAEFHVMVRPRQMTAATAGNYQMDHSSMLFLMDGRNHLVSMFPVDSSAEEIATRLRNLLPAQ
ncbi:SCO family protein [Gluconacetobacter entanii]|uniref:SCO family protein n=1 Tax=Gluconacetobacter entanii TaxID=108528 RepID=A0ABT3K802_9PROT|nr:SCO family protein [Gluconacetobacter entanii]MCW4591246.1 SCO family protein [Gluconacetobacter entanii]MCW4595488.1 SCO family protein [Gluconacetobacter entanii]NPC88570.1 SCO family protein [Gluconacetobacter entanii]